MGTRTIAEADQVLDVLTALTDIWRSRGGTA
jgi:hypothetical protein